MLYSLQDFQETRRSERHKYLISRCQVRALWWHWWVMSTDYLCHSLTLVDIIDSWPETFCLGRGGIVQTTSTVWVRVDLFSSFVAAACELLVRIRTKSKVLKYFRGRPGSAICELKTVHCRLNGWQWRTYCIRTTHVIYVIMSGLRWTNVEFENFRQAKGG